MVKHGEVNKGKLYGLRVYAKALKRYISLSVLIRLVSDGQEDRQVAALFLYRRFDGWMRSFELQN